MNNRSFRYTGNQIFTQTTVPKEPNKITVINRKNNINCIYNKDAIIPAPKPITTNAKFCSCKAKPKPSNRYISTITNNRFQQVSRKHGKNKK